jgi:predicted AlkP superfamily pyrophosphatase or phosphodiesterase
MGFHFFGEFKFRVSLNFHYTWKMKQPSSRRGFFVDGMRCIISTPRRYLARRGYVFTNSVSYNTTNNVQVVRKVKSCWLDLVMPGISPKWASKLYDGLHALFEDLFAYFARRERSQHACIALYYSPRIYIMAKVWEPNSSRMLTTHFACADDRTWRWRHTHGRQESCWWNIRYSIG